jgi:hypothetical protein
MALTIENTPELEFADPGPLGDQVVTAILSCPGTRESHKWGKVEALNE